MVDTPLPESNSSSVNVPVTVRPSTDKLASTVVVGAAPSAAEKNVARAASSELSIPRNSTSVSPVVSTRTNGSVPPLMSTVNPPVSSVRSSRTSVRPRIGRRASQFDCVSPLRAGSARRTPKRRLPARPPNRRDRARTDARRAAKD